MDKQIYLASLAEAIKSAALRFVYKTEQKETVVIDHDPITGSISLWIEGRYRITIEDIYELKRSQK